MSKRIETNVPPMHPFILADCELISTDPHASTNERRLARIVLELNLVVNELLCRLEYGQVSITDEQPKSNNRYTADE